MNDSTSIFARLGGVLTDGIGSYIDGEALQRYGVYRGQVVADPQGNTTAAGTPFAGSTLAGLTPTQIAMIVGGLVLALVLVKKLA